jgi:hypothetical protein
MRAGAVPDGVVHHLRTTAVVCAVCGVGTLTFQLKTPLPSFSPYFGNRLGPLA